MRPKTLKSLIRWVIYIIITFVLIGIISTAALFIYANSFVDTSFMSEVNNFKLNFSSVVYAYDKDKNSYVEVEFLHAGENRIWVNYDKVPKNLINAFIAIEDKRFYSHNGVDWKRTAGAVLSFVTGSDRYGGSTITQQFIKNITGDNQARPDRKIREIVRAIQLEKKLSKEEILELYLNTSFMGSNYYGVQSAANGYFGKDVSELNLAECASLAGITNLPTKYNPLINPTENKKRQEIILGEMLEQEIITQKEYDSAVAYKLVFNTSVNSAKSNNRQSYFADQLITQLLEDLQKKGYTKQAATNMIYSGGLKIYSTMEPSVQKSVTQVFSNSANFPTLSGTIQPEAAMIILDPKTGDVVAMYGGRGEKTADRTLNRAMQITRSPGSTIKPIAVYAPALEAGVITSGDIVEDSPFNKELMWPKNYYNEYKGTITLQYAVEQSVNTAAVKVLDKLSPQKSFDFLQNNLKVSSLVRMSNGKTDMDYSPLALGGLTNGISVLDLAAAYVPFDNNGIYSKPRIYSQVLDSSGNVILECKKESSVAMSEETAFIMNKLLQRVITNGTGTPAQLKGGAQPAAGKTGTTDDDNDRWFVGYTPYYVGAVWFGYDSPKTVSGVSVNPALALWKKVMENVHTNLPNVPFPDSQANVTNSYYCTKSGKAPGLYCPAENIGVAWYKKGTQPSQTCNVHNLVTATFPENHANNHQNDDDDHDNQNINPQTEQQNTSNNTNTDISTPPDWLR